MTRRLVFTFNLHTFPFDKLEKEEKKKKKKWCALASSSPMGMAEAKNNLNMLQIMYTDIMVQFLGPETDIMGKRYYILNLELTTRGIHFIEIKKVQILYRPLVNQKQMMNYVHRLGKYKYFMEQSIYQLASIPVKFVEHSGLTCRNDQAKCYLFVLSGFSDFVTAVTAHIV